MRTSKRLALMWIAGLAMPVGAFAQVLFDNGGVVTTPTGACIPVGSTSSQLQTVAGIPNGTYGVGHQLVGSVNNRVADDFTVTDPAGWAITTIDFLDYQTNAPVLSSPITAINVRIWNGPPSSPTSTVVFGDTTTNRMTASVPGTTYRIGSACDLKRLLFKSTVAINTTLGPGTYWLDWQAIGNATYSGPWVPTVTITGSRGKPGANAVQSLNGAWSAILDSGPSPDFSSPPVAQDIPFTINGSVSGSCYANCDNSTVPPVLNSLDFGCFLSRFAANDTYANCDNSTANPVLNSLDFGCYLSKFAAGCT